MHNCKLPTMTSLPPQNDTTSIFILIPCLVFPECLVMIDLVINLWQISHPQSRLTASHSSCGDLEVLRVLVERSADVNVQGQVCGEGLSKFKRGWVTKRVSPFFIIPSGFSGLCVEQCDCSGLNFRSLNLVRATTLELSSHFDSVLTSVKGRLRLVFEFVHL